MKVTSDGSTASYYELPEGAKELQDLISHRDMNAQMGEIFRACYRYGQASHSDKMRDAKKIRFYIEAEIARLGKLECQANFTGGEDSSLTMHMPTLWDWHKAPEWATHLMQHFRTGELAWSKFFEGEYYGGNDLDSSSIFDAPRYWKIVDTRPSKES